MMLQKAKEHQMSKLDSKPLSMAVLHQNLGHVPNVGNVEKTFTMTQDAKHKAVKSMVICEPWVLVEFYTQNPKKTVEVPIPITNFSHTVLAE